MTTLKRFLEVVLLFLGGLGAFGQTIQIGNLQIPMANVQPVDSNAIPEHGTFYLLQDCLNSRDAAPPCPDDPYPQYQAYSLGLDGLYLVDNTGIANETIEQILTPLFIIPDPNAPGAPPINWPVSPNGLQLVDPNNVPEFGTFYLYQDQFASDPPDPPPYPSVPEFALSASVYALSTNDQYLIDDTGMTRPDPEPTPEYSSPNYGTNLALCIKGLSNHVAYLVLTNTLPGTDYDILSKQALSDLIWSYEGTIAGAANQNYTEVGVPVGIYPNGVFFWAQASQEIPAGTLWLEITGVSGGYVLSTCTIQAETPSMKYCPENPWGKIVGYRKGPCRA